MLALLGAVSLGWTAGCNPNTQNANPALAQTVIELGDAVNEIRQDNATLQNELDSLRAQVARQDTVMRQLAAVAGVQLPPPPPQP